MDQFNIECTVCFEPYDIDPRGNKRPIQLPCGHTFSFDCLEALYEIGQNQTIICPIDRIETRIENVNELTVNRALIDLLNNNLESIKISIRNNEKTIENLLTETKKTIRENKSHIADLEDRLHLHVNSIKTVMVEANETIKSYDINSRKTKPISNYLNELKKDLEYYAETLLIVGNKRDRLNRLENEMDSQDSIDSIVTLHVTISQMANFLRSQSNDEKIKRNTVGLEKFLKLKKEFNSNVSVILQGFREKKKQKPFHIGLIGLMSI